MAPSAVTDSDFEKTVKKAKGLVLVDFWAAWCGPCKMLNPIIEEVSEEAKDAKVLALNTDENQDTAQEYQVFSIPTVILFKDGEPVESWVGVRQKKDYLDGINKHK